MVLVVTVDEDGHQELNVTVDTEDVPYITAHGMLSMAAAMLPVAYRHADEFDDDYEEGGYDA